MCAALCAALETVTMVIVHQDTIQVKNAHIKLLQYIPAIMWSWRLREHGTLDTATRSSQQPVVLHTPQVCSLSTLQVTELGGTQYAHPLHGKEFRCTSSSLCQTRQTDDVCMAHSTFHFPNHNAIKAYAENHHHHHYHQCKMLYTLQAITQQTTCPIHPRHRTTHQHGHKLLQTNSHYIPLIPSTAALIGSQTWWQLLSPIPPHTHSNYMYLHITRHSSIIHTSAGWGAAPKG